MGTNESVRLNGRRSLPGIVAFIAGIVTALSAAMIGFTSFTAFNPPDWIRIVTMAPFPLAILVALGFGLVGLRRNAGRVWAIAGLVLAGLAVVAFIIMISTASG